MYVTIKTLTIYI